MPYRHTFKCTIAAAAVLLTAFDGHASPSSDPMTISAHGLVVLPQGDSDDVAETSLGMRAAYAYWFRPFIAAVGSIEYIVGNEKDEIDGDYSFYAVSVGARFAHPKPLAVRPFGEILLGRHTASFDGPGFEDTQSDLGFRIGGGLSWRASSSLSAVAQLSYLTAEIEDVDIDSVAFEVGLAWTL